MHCSSVAEHQHERRVRGFYAGPTELRAVRIGRLTDGDDASVRREIRWDGVGSIGNDAHDLDLAE
jgi:hypothetical protein